jgi:hypothetical protein
MKLLSRLIVGLITLFVCNLPPCAFGQGYSYSKIEASFNLSGLATDPFDYTVTDVEVQIAQPNASTITLPAFFDGGTTWRVRHAPTMAGTYTITAITLDGAPAAVSNLQPTNWVITGFPASPGYVRVDPANSRRFITSNGRRFFPVGENMAWSSPAANALNIFPKMGAAHENWSRVWMTHFYEGSGLGLNLDWPKVNNTFGQLSLPNAQHWDAIVAAADQAGIHFQMTLQHHGQYSSTVDPNWPQNPYNTANGGFLSSATNFFTDATAKSLTKRKLRYAIARWGYSPAIMAWELFNEVQFTDAGQNGQWSNIGAWHNEMAQFFRTNDFYHHLITTSSDMSQPIWDQCDYYTHHDYPSDVVSGLRDAPDISDTQPVKPVYGAECATNGTPHLGVNAPLWSGLMAGQSGNEQPWWWDGIDAANDYIYFRAASDFVTASGLGDQDSVNKSIPAVLGGSLTALSFAPGGGWSTASQDTFNVNGTVPDGIGAAPSYLQGTYHRDMTPNGYTFLVNYPQAGTFSVQVLTIAASGAGLQISVDGVLKTNLAWAGAGVDVNTNYTTSVSVSSGAHSVLLWNPGLDWINLGNITLNPYASMLGAYAVGNTNFFAAWLWHRTNLFNLTASTSVTGAVSVAGLNPGTYSATWWDTFAGTVISNFNVTISDTNPISLNTPAILRSTALYLGLPAHAGVVPPGLTQAVPSNSPPFNLPVLLTNSGGLPLAYSLSFTSAVPSWLTFSTTNGYVPKSGSLTAWLGVNPAGLPPGTYTFTVFLNTSDPLQSVTVLPVSLTILSGAPAPPQLAVLPALPGQFVFQVQGQTSVPYVVQSSLDLLTWTFVSTNVLPGGTMNFTNPILPAPSHQFWRALWQQP